MKRKILIGLTSLLLVACAGNKENTTQNSDSKNTKTTVDTGKDTKQSEWKWDLLKKDIIIEIFNTKYEAGVLLSNREDLGGFVYTGDSKKNGGKLDRAYVFKKSTSKLIPAPYRISDIKDLESKFLVRENLFFSGLAGLLPGSGEYEWIIQERGTKKHLDIEFVHLKGEIKAYSSLDKQIAAIHKEKPELKSYFEGYFAVVENKDKEKDLIAIYRNWTNETSQETADKSKRAIEQLIESIREKK